MIDYNLLLAFLTGIILLLVLVLKVRLHAFISLLISSIVVGVMAGLSPAEIVNTMQEGMASTLGFVAVVVGLGAMFGAILEHSGGANALANYLLRKCGDKNASWAMTITGFIVAIPVFFDVAFIILVPMIYALQRKSGKSILLYGIPLLAGLAITHAFIPPTPGPVAVADILQVDLGWVILIGGLVGIPAAIISGPLFGRYIAGKIHINAPILTDDERESTLPKVWKIIAIIAVPIFLIVADTLLNSSLFEGSAIVPIGIKKWIEMIGHPFSALIIANLVAWWVLGLKGGMSRENLMKITTKSMEPAGIIILLTGAGGVLKQMLVNTGTGEMLANYFAEAGISVLLFAFISAALIRIFQGSTTVAMITAAGLTSPIIQSGATDIEKALVVIAIAAGALILSHVNDSGFWLVGKYLNLSEKETLRSWTMMTTIISLVSFATVGLLHLLLV